MKFVQFCCFWWCCLVLVDLGWSCDLGDFVWSQNGKNVKMKANEKVDPQWMHTMRVGVVKEKILRGLGLNGPPNVTVGDVSSGHRVQQRKQKQQQRLNGSLGGKMDVGKTSSPFAKRSQLLHHGPIMQFPAFPGFAFPSSPATQLRSVTKEYGKYKARIIVFAELGPLSPCSLPSALPAGLNRSSVTSLTFKLPSTASPSSITNAILSFHSVDSSHQANKKLRRRTWICSCTNSDTSASYRKRHRGGGGRNHEIKPSQEAESRGQECVQLKGSWRPWKGNWTNVVLGPGRRWKSVGQGTVGGSRIQVLLERPHQDSVEVPVQGPWARAANVGAGFGPAPWTGGGGDRKIPYLTLEIGSETMTKRNRAKRQTAGLAGLAGQPPDCIDGHEKAEVAPKCCRTGFWVDIEQLGWHNWIISPLGFYFYQCIGTCNQGFDRIIEEANGPSAAAPGELGSRSPPPPNTPKLDYFMALNAYIRKMRLSLRPCCVPTKHSHLPLVYTTDGLTFNRSFIPNVIVEQCTCHGFA